MSKKIFVTQPSLPPLDEFVDLLKVIWEKKWITNNGIFHQDLEQALAEYLEVRYVSLFSNGTLALITAMQALRISGEVITTPYTFVATTNAMHWNGIKPVFVDVDKKYANLDPEKIESAITNNTTAIIPVHVYGNPADVEAIEKIADIYGLKIIYDAAHAFGVKLNNQSVLNYGDLSILSFHATKVYNTIEGGAIISHDKKTKDRIDYLKNFGFADETTVIAPGINGKMNELQAAYGLLQLNYIDESIEKRQNIAHIYDEGLKEIRGINILSQNPNATNNYPYYPILINEQEYGESRDKLYNRLIANGIHGRRYFYPIVSEFPMYRGYESSREGNLPNSTEISNEVICLPIYPGLEIVDVNKIIGLIGGK